MSKSISCPYRSLPPSSYWAHNVARPEGNAVDPVVNGKFKITSRQKIATAGSCFAQHIARHLSQSGYNYFVPEPGPAMFDAHTNEELGYGLFSCRYANIYSSRQLLQLFQRAFGQFTPREAYWREADGSFVDPFRPFVQPGNFTTIGELMTDRDQHLAAVRTMFEEADVFVFTMGLTESWLDRRDAAAYPVCPGCGAGTHYPGRYVFHNESYEDVMAHMTAFVEGLREVNEGCRIILTVSPVPLIATARPDATALTATTYSKSVLRVAAEALSQKWRHVAYFPSYEIITGAHARGRYFADDLRSVTSEGVEHVMKIFMHHYGGETATPGNEITSGKEDSAASPLWANHDADDVVCDELIMMQRSS